MTPELSEILALKALQWIAEDDDLINRFCALSGLSAQTLLSEASRPETLAAILDFLLSDEQTLLSFCEASDLPPQTPMQARAFLPGGDLPHWT